MEQEAKARAAEQARLLEHEKELTAITAAENAKIRTRRIVIGSIVAILLGAVGSYAFLIKPALDRKAFEAERARQEQQMALEEKQRAQEELVEAKESAAEAEEAKEQLAQKLEAREQRRKEREARAKERPKQRAKPKDKGCAPDDPLCGIKFD